MSGPIHRPRFVFFGGKGGVGKTTCAAAWAIEETRRGRRVLVVSTDPAHSLGDALDVPLTWRVSKVRAGTRTLSALELNGPRAYARWLTGHRRALGEAIEHGTWLDADDVTELLDLPIPGIDELVAMLEIVRLSTTAAYDLVVVDTAPTGHALRLLGAPDSVRAVARVLDELQQEHRVIRARFARTNRPEAADRLAALLAGQASDTSALLRDRHRTAFHWVLLPEALSIAESEDGLAALERFGIHVPDLIVNRVTPDGPVCAVCDGRRDAERSQLADLGRRLPSHRIRIVTAELREPRGIERLGRIGKQLAGKTRLLCRKGKRRSMALSVAAGARTTSPENIAEFHGARLLLFGGKGGVGKTTVAAVTAIRLATANPARRVLLISTDPAHSLGDVLNARTGDAGRPIPHGPANLDVRELDAAAALARRRRDLQAALGDIAHSFRSTDTASVDRGIDELMELAPPGLDELLGVLEVSESVGEASVSTSSPSSRSGRGAPYDLVVVDTAPTGHALRLLEMPDVTREWAQVLLRMLLKYRDVVRPTRLASELLAMSKSIRRLQDLLHDSASTRFVVVTRAAEVPRRETVRLFASLRRLRLSMPAIVVNAMTLGPGRCSRCRQTAGAERRELDALMRAARRLRRDCAIILTPLASAPPRGRAALEEWASAWTEVWRPVRTSSV